MSVQASSIVAADTSPQPGELWDLSTLSLANWAERVKLATAWLTEIAPAKNGGETRTGRMGRPMRTLTFSAMMTGIRPVRRLQSLITRSAVARSLVPLYCDVSFLTDTAAGTSVPCDTTCRRFAIGARVAIALPMGSGLLSSYEVGEIAAIADDEITLASPLTGTFAAGCRVWPLIEGELVPQASTAAITDQAAQTTLTFIETVGPSALPPIPAPTLATYLDSPIFNLQLDWEDVGLGVDRLANLTQLGIGRHTQVYGSRPHVTRSLSYKALSRAAAWKMLGHFDDRRGRLGNFWLPSPLTDIQHIAVSTGTITCTANGPLSDWAYAPAVAVVLNDGTVHVRKLASWGRASTTDTLTLASSLPSISAGNIRRVCSAALVRFASDELLEEWVTDEAMIARFTAVEVQDASIDLAHIVDVITGTTREPCECGPGGGPVTRYECGTCSFSSLSRAVVSNFTISTSYTDARVLAYVAAANAMPKVAPLLGSGGGYTLWQRTAELTLPEPDPVTGSTQGRINLTVAIVCETSIWSFSVDCEVWDPEVSDWVPANFFDLAGQLSHILYGHDLMSGTCDGASFTDSDGTRGGVGTSTAPYFNVTYVDVDDDNGNIIIQNN